MPRSLSHKRKQPGYTCIYLVLKAWGDSSVLRKNQGTLDICGSLSDEEKQALWVLLLSMFEYADNFKIFRERLIAANWENIDSVIQHFLVVGSSLTVKVFIWTCMWRLHFAAFELWFCCNPPERMLKYFVSNLKKHKHNIKGRHLILLCRIQRHWKKTQQWKKIKRTEVDAF